MPTCGHDAFAASRACKLAAWSNEVENAVGRATGPGALQASLPARAASRRQRDRARSLPLARRVRVLSLNPR